jgi:NADPH:quinone reductase-like Zn-dependent oxidoreductase
MTTLDRAVMEKVLGLAARGEIKGRIGKVLPLTQAAEAHRLMDGLAVVGKIVLV